MKEDALRQSLMASLGHFPKSVPLETTFEQVFELDDHTRTRVTYGVEPGERVSTWLLSPKGAAPDGGWPAILAIHQHGGQFDLGKSEPAGLIGNPVYAYGLELCRRGYIVLCPDLLCFEERRPPEEIRLRSHGMLDGAGYERFEFTRRVLFGSCLQTKYLHDLTCALDLLTSLPTVDATHLGVIGHSLGGQETLWLTWYDSRVAAAVSSCGFDLLHTILRDGINHNMAVYVPGLLEICDVDALISSIAPRPFLLTAGETDAIFPIDGVRSLVAKAQDAYAQAAVPDRFRSIIFPSGHSFPADVKEEAYAFLDHWLKRE